MIYIISFSVNMLMGVFLLRNVHALESGGRTERSNRAKRRYLVFTALQLGLLCGFRSTVMNYDTGAYKIIFNMAHGSFDKIFQKSSYVEVGFSAFCSLIKIFGGDFQTMLVLSSLFVVGSCCVFIYRHSKNVLLSVFIIQCFPFFYSSFDTIRHFIAVGFFLLGFQYIEKRKPIKYAIYIIAGSFFQSAILIFLPFYFIRKIKWSAATAVIAVILTALCFFFITPVAYWLFPLLGKSTRTIKMWVGVYGGGVKTAVMYFGVLLLSIFAYLNLKEKTADDMSAVNYVLLLFMCSVVFINASMMIRLITAIIPLMSIAIPQLTQRNRCKSGRANLSVIVCFVLVGLSYHAFMLSVNWQRILPYVPFWD